MKTKKREKTRKALTRRDFLRKSALLGVGALAAPAVVPSSVFGMDGAVAPSERLNLGFIGLGIMGRNAHLRGLIHRENVQILALCDVDAKKLDMSREIAENFYGSKMGWKRKTNVQLYHDFRDLLAREDIDAVVIATPDHWHSIPSIMAAEAGKDIYCEKPMTHTLSEGRAVVNAVRRYGRVFQTGSQQRSDFGGHFIKAAELVRNGRLGDIQKIYVQVGGPGEPCYLPPEPVLEELDWDFWVGPAPYRPYSSVLAPPYTYGGFPNWRLYSDYGGGMLFDFGAHHFDIAQWAMGMDHSGPVEIIPPDGKEHERLTFVYANGIPVYHNGGQGSVEFVGTKGIVRASRGGISSEPASILDEVLGPEEVHLNRNKTHHQDWLDCIKTREKPVADVEIGHRTMSVCHLGYIAYTLNRPLKWDPVQEKFIDDPEADRLLTYPMRSPWHL